jgi:hypothetical protein
VLVTPFGTFRGPEEIRALEERFFQSNPGLDAAFGERTVVLDTVVVRELFASDPMRQAGIARIAILYSRGRPRPTRLAAPRSTKYGGIGCSCRWPSVRTNTIGLPLRSQRK